MPPASANMTLLTRHADTSRTHIFASDEGEPSIYFRSNLDVNTDGASRSYHPDDPRGRSLALNNIANAITGIWNASGAQIDCSPRRDDCFMRYINTFIAARDSNYNPHGYPKVATRHIIPWKMDPELGWRVPCTIRSGPYRGYFVSQTAFIIDGARDECDQDRYLDSLAFKAVVLPKEVAWTSDGRRAAIGDLVVVRNVGGGRIHYAILGDSGPATGLGEGSIALAAALRGTNVSPTASYQEIKALVSEDVQYLVFPGSDIRRLAEGRIMQADIDREASRLFTAWGGVDRLNACSTLQRP